MRRAYTWNTRGTHKDAWNKTDAKITGDDSLSDVSQQLDDVVGGDFAAVLAVQRRKLSVHVQAALSIFKHLPRKQKEKKSWQDEKHKEDNEWWITKHLQSLESVQELNNMTFVSDHFV